jgi:hypothetical protein
MLERFTLRIIEDETGEVMEMRGNGKGEDGSGAIFIESVEDANRLFKEFSIYFRRRAKKFVLGYGYEFNYRLEAITGNEGLRKRFNKRLEKLKETVRKEILENNTK